MIKKGCKNRCKHVYYFIFIIILFIFLSNFIILVLGADSNNKNKNLDEARKYGENLFTSLGTPGYDKDTVTSYFNNEEERKAFFEGFDSAWKDEKKQKEIIDNFLSKNEKGVAKIPDGVKIKILQHLSEMDGEEHNKLLTELAKQKINTYNLKGSIFEGVNIPKDKIKELTFEGSKLGIANKDGKFDAWVDFDKISRWTKKIELGTSTVNGKEVTSFKFEFKTKYGGGTRTVIFSKGTIGPNGELIGPDGIPIGSKMSGIESIGLNKDGKFEVKYRVGDKEKILTLENSELRGAIANLKEQLAKSGVDTSKVDVDEILKKINGKALTTGRVSGADSNGLVFSNQLNVLFGNIEGDNRDQMEVSYDSNGNPEIKTKGTATVVTTGFDGNALVGAELWRDPASTDGTKESILRYNKYGELKEAQNAMINADIARVYAPDGKFTKIDIVENSIADAISRGDKKSAIEAGLMQAGIVDKILAKGDKSNVEAEIAEAVFQELNKATGSTTFQNRLNEARGALEKNIQDSITNLMTFGTPNEDVSGKQKLAGDLTLGAESALRSFVENPDNLKALATGDKQTLKAYLKEYIKSNPLLANLDTEIGQTAIGFSGKTPAEVKQKFKEYIDGPEFEQLISDTVNQNTGTNSQSTGQRIAESIKSKLSEIKVGDKPLDLGKVPDNLGSYVDNLITQAQARVIVEKENFQKNLRENFQTSYGTDSVLRVDKSNGEIFAQGDNNLVVELKSTLNKVVANPIGNANIRLYSYGDYSQPLAQFTTGGTTFPTTPLKNSYQIGLITNQNIQNQVFTVQNFGQGYRVYDAKDVVNKFAGWGTATVTKGGIPIIGSISIPFNTVYNVINAGVSGDIADNPNSKVEITYKPNTDWGPLPGRFFVGRIINRIANKKANEIAQKKPFEVSQIGNSLQQSLDKQYGDMLSNFNGDTSGFTRNAAQLTQLVNFAQDNGVTISRQTELSDSLSLLSSMGSGKQEFISRFQPIINALNSNQITYGQSVQITPNQIIAGGRVIYEPKTPQEQVALRMFLRNIDPNQLTQHRDINA